MRYQVPVVGVDGACGVFYGLDCNFGELEVELVQDCESSLLLRLILGMSVTELPKFAGLDEWKGTDDDIRKVYLARLSGDLP